MHYALAHLGSIFDLKNEQEWSGTELYNAAKAQAHGLSSLGVGTGDRVLLVNGNNADFFVDLFSIWLCGACACCVNTASKANEIENLAAFVNARLILATQEQISNTPTSLPVPTFFSERPRKQSGSLVATNYLDSEALVLFTSGTTGEPKGVTHTFRSLLSRIALNLEHIPDKDRHVTYCPLPTHFGHGLIGNCLTPLFGGNKLVLGDLGEASSFSSLIDNYGITFLSSVPAFWKKIIRTPQPTKNTIRRVHIGSAPLSKELWEQVTNWCGTENVWNMYGITEAANWIGGARAGQETFESGYLGKPWGGQYAVRTPEGALCSAGYGEIAILSPSLMKGYLYKPDLTNEVFRGCYFLTGDSGHVDYEGNAWLIGRKKFEINVGGMKVNPEEIDLLLASHPDVDEACAFGLDDEAAGEVVAVAVKLVTGCELDVQALETHIKIYTVDYKCPTRWFSVEEIPKNERGKTNRADVARYCTENSACLESTANIDDVDFLIQQALKNESTQIRQENWDSLKRLRLTIAIEEKLGRTLRADEIQGTQSFKGVRNILLGMNNNSFTILSEEKTNRRKLVNILENAGLHEKPYVILLLSYRFLEKHGIQDINLFYDDLLTSLDRSSTLLLPSFTWVFMRQGVYDPATSASEVGMASELFRRRTDVTRTDHPAYNYSAWGRGIGDRLLIQETKDSWGKGSVVSKLYNSPDCKVIGLGTMENGYALSAATGLHVIEQEFEVSYRYHKSFSGMVLRGDFKESESITMFVRDRDKCAGSDWTPAEKIMLNRRLLYVDETNNIYSYNTIDLMNIGRELLSKDQEIFRG